MFIFIYALIYQDDDTDDFKLTYQKVMSHTRERARERKKPFL